MLDIRYGAGQKQQLDLFRVSKKDAPTLVYFHGGYWQRGDKSIYSFLAPSFNSREINFVAVGYDLCPAVTITEISAQAREALKFIWQSSNMLGINRNFLTVMGHSAGGHITQMMMGTNWPAYSNDLPADLIKAGVPISPLSLLEPVRLTEALNVGIRMDAKEAESESPMINHPPSTDAPQLVVVGGDETEEFHRQAKMYVEAFSTQKRLIEMYTVPGVDHFDELNILADKDSEFFSKIIKLMRSTVNARK
jgi:arylformamidase